MAEERVESVSDPADGGAARGAAPDGVAPAATDGERAAPAAAEAGGDRAANEVTSQFGETHAEKIINANAVYEQYQIFVSESGEDFTLRAFSADYCAPVSPQREQEIEETVVADEWVTARLFNSLMTKRLLILAGEPEIGKQTLALHLSGMVRRARVQTCRQTFLVRPPHRRVKLELQKVAENKKEFGQRVLIFPQVGEGENRDLLDLFAGLRGFELDKLTHAAAESDSYLIFTADASNLKSCKEDLQGLDILHELEPPSGPMLERVLERKVERLLASRAVPEAKAEAARALVAQHKGLLAGRLLKMSRLALFAERYLLDLVGESPKLDLEAAVDLVGNPKRWFLEDLGKDFEAWCFVFTLTLCQCGSDTGYVPWTEFETIRKEITRHLSRELRMWRPPQPEAAFTNLLEEDALLERCRAQVVREAGVGDVVRFADGNYPTQLWRVFINSNRRALTSALPPLRALAQSDDLRIRARAARVLGRLGEINPPHLALSTIRDWVAAKSLRRKAAVGYLYEGVLASQDKSYQQICRAELEHLSLSSRTDELWTAIAVYKQLGQGGGERLALAVAKLGEITERCFAGWMGWERKIERLLEEYMRKKRKDFQELLAAAAGVQTLKELRHELRQAYDEDSRIMLAISYSLVALSLHLGPYAVITELDDWFQRGRQELSALTSWMFWTEEGIADRLAEYTVPSLSVTAVNDGARDCHPLVVSLGLASQGEPQAVSRMSRFLALTYSHLSEYFPPRMRQLLRKKFLLHLTGWAGSAWVVKSYRQVMHDLYVELLLSPNTDLAETLRSHLRSHSEFVVKAHLRRFADTVLQTLDERRRQPPGRPAAG